MPAPNLLVICLNAFLAVLVLLSLLALAMRLLIAVLPVKSGATSALATAPVTSAAGSIDPALAAAMTTAAHAAFPGLHVTRIEEVPRKESA